MRDRIDILKQLLRQDGSIWVHCDDNEQAYLKVVLDEVFGRSAFVATIVWQSRYSRSNDASLSMSHNISFWFIHLILSYGKQFGIGTNKAHRTAEQNNIQIQITIHVVHGFRLTIQLRYTAESLIPNFNSYRENISSSTRAVLVTNRGSMAKAS